MYVFRFSWRAASVFLLHMCAHDGADLKLKRVGTCRPFVDPLMHIVRQACALFFLLLHVYLLLASVGCANDCGRQANDACLQLPFCQRCTASFHLHAIDRGIL